MPSAVKASFIVPSKMISFQRKMLALPVVSGFNVCNRNKPAQNDGDPDRSYSSTPDHQKRAMSLAI